MAESALDKVYVGNEALDNVLQFEYLGSQLQGDGEDEADVRHRMDVAQAAFGSLSHLWSDHRLSRATKLRLYRTSVCSTLTHSCEAWTLTRTVVRMINDFNSRCLHAITGEDYRTTAAMPVYNLVLSVRKRRLRYLGHVLRLPAESIVRRSLLALGKGGAQYPGCEAALPQLEALSLDRSAWRDKGRDRFASSGRGISSAGSRIVAHETIDQTETGRRWLTMFTFLPLQLKYKNG